MPTTSPTPAVIVAHATASFTVLGVPSEHVGPAAVSHPHSSRQKTSRTGSTLATPPQQTRGIFLDVNEPYTRGVIAQALQARSSLFHVVHGLGVGEEPVPLPSECDFQWSEYERIDWDAVLAGRHGAASYCVRKGLSRKAQMAYYTRLHVAKHPTSLLRRAIPTTVVLDTWPVWEEGGHATARGLADILVTAAAPTSGSTNRRERLEQCLVEAAQAMREATEAFEARQDESAAYPVWILKGSTVNKGMGIYIVHLYEQVVDICWSETDIREWVLQRYIDSPVLLRRRKFHIRAYAVAVGALEVYLDREALALCSGSPYKQSQTDDLFAHITNTAYQDKDPNFDESKCVLLWDKAEIAPLLVSGRYCKDLDEAGQRVDQVMEDMKEITAELFRAYEGEFGVFAPIDGCFEHYGIDFMVNDDWQVYLLEVNPGPDFKQTGSRLQAVIDNLMNATIDVALTPARESPILDRIYSVQQSSKRGKISMKLQ